MLLTKISNVFIRPSMGRKEDIMRHTLITENEKLNSYAKGGLRAGHLSDR